MRPPDDRNAASGSGRAGFRTPGDAGRGRRREAGGQARDSGSGSGLGRKCCGAGERLHDLPSGHRAVLRRSDATERRGHWKRPRRSGRLRHLSRRRPDRGRQGGRARRLAGVAGGGRRAAYLLPKSQRGLDRGQVLRSVSSGIRGAPHQVPDEHRGGQDPGQPLVLGGAGEHEGRLGQLRPQRRGRPGPRHRHRCVPQVHAGVRRGASGPDAFADEADPRGRSCPDPRTPEPRRHHLLAPALPCRGDRAGEAW